MLGVSPSRYYAWRKGPLSRRARADVELSAHIDAIHRASRGTYGAPRVRAELAALGIHIGRKRVARLMRALGVQGVSRRRWPRTTVREPAQPPAPDLVARDFTAPGPDHLWVADITYIPTGGGLPVPGRRPRRVESARDRPSGSWPSSTGTGCAWRNRAAP